MAPSTSKSINEGSQQNPSTSNVDVASVDSIKLDGQSNYVQWQKQMLSLIDSKEMRGHIDGTVKEPQMTYGSKTRAGALAYATKHGDWKKSDTVVRELILGSLSEDVKGTVVGLETAYDIWNALKANYYTITYEKMEKGSIQYPYPSHVNAASFVSIKLGKSNYVSWRKQMMTLVSSHDMLGFVNGNIKRPQTKDTEDLMWARSDALVQGWIYGSLTEDVMATIVHLNTAHDVWITLKEIYSTPPAPLSGVTNDFDKYIELRKAIDTGDWEKAEVIFNQHEKALIDPIDQNGNTALRIAIGNKANIIFLEKLLNQIVFNKGSYQTLAKVLRYAIECGNDVAVKKLVQKDVHLLFVEDDAYLPLVTAAVSSRRNIFDYLFKACKHNIELNKNVTDGYINPFVGKAGFTLLTYTISAGFFDIAYDLVKNDCPPELPMANHIDIEEALYVPIENCCDTRNNPDIENQETNKANLGTWKSNVDSVTERIYAEFWKAVRHVPHIKRLHEDKVKHNKVLTILKFICKEVSKLEDSGPEYYEKALILAVENNIPEVIEHITKRFPLSIQNTRDNGYTLYELSIMYRSENAYNYLVHEKTYQEDLHHQDSLSSDDNLLHMAAKLAPQDKLNMVTGAALQMQRELQWFEEVRKLVSTKEREAKNKEKKTPIMVFKNEHEDLRKKGEEWMKSTADSYTITAALIVTIVFAAAITVPGGTNGDTGKAIYNTKPSFKVFIVSDAISLFTSTTSLLLFLSILTARYAEEDFLYKLPRRLIFARVMLFVSMTTMLMAFGATLYIMSGQDNSLILIPIVMMTCLPIISFMTLQLPLLVDLIYSTYGHGIFGNLSTLGITS
ncbi:hypothetical protein M8C21_004823 [Ambrosia artemisiifolia]|uniref:Uncharacterized protein n=1 Tax=Ambrosia artemisiifolia TaxID=4212 RepID=A0AAD5D6Q6_AMBAR|nr:hypothetical protein M8C21_004823 [Ambrosia artemisiifolia]